MEKTIVDYYKKVIKMAERAGDTINRARADYDHECEVAKGAYEADLLGEQGYQNKLKELESERDSLIDGGLSWILKVVDEFDAEMDEIGRLDGSQVDSGILKLLSSGVSLNSKDWQRLANDFRDNETMTRILKQKYDENRPQEKEPVVVQFGQSSESRKEVFSKFVKTLYHSCESGAVPSLSGSGKFKTATDFYNYLAQTSLEDMRPFGEESFDNLNADFPVETVNGKVENATKKATSYSPADFNFGFTPVRGNNTGDMF